VPRPSVPSDLSIVHALFISVHPFVGEEPTLGRMNGGTIATVVGIVIAAALTIWGTLYAVRAARSRPKPRFNLDGASAGVAQFSVQVSNPGGEAAFCSSLAHVGRDFYEYRGPVAGSLQSAMVVFKRRGTNAAPTPSAVPIIRWVAAQDSTGKWWDVVRRRRIRGLINSWLHDRSEEAGLPIPVQV
jgi:hypothetical protein